MAAAQLQSCGCDVGIRSGSVRGLPRLTIWSKGIGHLPCECPTVTHQPRQECYPSARSIPFVIEAGAESMEAAWLRGERKFGRAGGILLEGSVHAFVGAVLLRAGRLDELGANAEADPPDGEVGEAAE